MELRNRIAIITGGASGLGAATVAHFQKLGMYTAIFDIDRDGGEDLVGKFGDRAAYYHVDVTDGPAITAAVAGVVERWGGVHACCNFAGDCSGP